MEWAKHDFFQEIAIKKDNFFQKITNHIKIMLSYFQFKWSKPSFILLNVMKTHIHMYINIFLKTDKFIINTRNGYHGNLDDWYW